MRRLMAMGLTILALLAMTGPAGAGRTFVEEKEYSSSQGVSFDNQVNFYWTNLLAEVPMSVAPRWAKTVSLEITDQTGQPIAGHIHIDEDGDGKRVKSHDICAKTDAPLELPPNSTVEVMIISGTCGTAFSLPTSGTVSFTYGR